MPLNEPVETPEANLPKFNPLQKSNIPPGGQPKAAVAGTMVTLYDNAAEPEIDKIVIHNLAATAARYCINDSCTALVFHDVMAGGNAQDDGLGTVLTFYWQDGIQKITAFHETNALRIAVTKFYRQSSNNNIVI